MILLTPWYPASPLTYFMGSREEVGKNNSFEHNFHTAKVVKLKNDYFLHSSQISYHFLQPFFSNAILISSKKNSKKFQPFLSLISMLIKQKTGE